MTRSQLLEHMNLGVYYSDTQRLKWFLLTLQFEIYSLQALNVMVSWTSRVLVTSEHAGSPTHPQGLQIRTLICG